jgi:2-amino-4-hydroxy-6-hydroxymethyldihydropteridine diphosphokinase
MVTAYIGLGSNLGNCRENLQRAWTWLGQTKGVELLVLSSPYRSEPVGMESANWFINAAGCLKTSLQPEELLAEMLVIEAGLGRKRGPTETPEDRTIDLDLLYWDSRICNEPQMILPHPEIAGRLFVLLPLAEIGPEFIHPVLQKTSVEMLQDFMRKLALKDAEAKVHKTSWSTVDE